MLIATWIVTFILIIAVGIYAGTKIAHANQWSGSDRSMSAFAVGAMLGAWQIGGMSVVGAAQNGYTMGIAGCWYSIASGVYILFLGLLAGPLRKNLKTEALPDYLESRFSPGVARLQSYVWIIFGIIYIPIQLKTISSIIQIVLPGLNTGLAMFIGVTIAAIYTGFAGMKGSAAIGRVVCIATYVLLIFFVGTHIGDFGGYSGLIASLPEGYDKLSAMPTQQIIAWAVGGLLSSVVLQSALQPMLAAKDDKTACAGCIIGYILAAPICILTAIVGMMARAANDGLGIIFAVCTMIIAATMATMMMATGTILTNIYKKQINKNADDHQILKISRFGTIAVAYVSLLVGFFIPSAQMTNMFLTLTYCVTSPFSYSVVVGLFWKRVNAKASFASVIAGIVTAIAWVVLGLNGTLNVVYPTIVVSYVVGIIVTLATSPAEKTA